jgi:hypothetical protein
MSATILFVNVTIFLIIHRLQLWPQNPTHDQRIYYVAIGSHTETRIDLLQASQVKINDIMPYKLLCLRNQIKGMLDWFVPILICAAMHLLGLDIAQDDAMDPIHLVEQAIRLQVKHKARHPTSVKPLVQPSHISNFQLVDQPSILEPICNIPCFGQI